MISLAQVKSVIVENYKRIIKVVQFGPKTAMNAAPFGDDSHPLKDMVAIYGKTSERGEPVILGYLNKNQIASVGEKRIFSLTPEGDLSFAVHLKNDGTCEIGGNSDNLIRFQPLNTAIQQMNTHVNQELTKIASAITSVGGTYTPTPLNIDISASKIESIKAP
ncbi:hypothetical protein [Muricauda sp. MAR_2010_75]|uniref:hypothetical protein n=1 Tax=Allomuricauda sp. MAR_2010_75 TaxID=1250232 RepID=UPI00055CB9E9|nr:hypothetical protein [Muricauda sp. MAR_2010_75]